MVHPGGTPLMSAVRCQGAFCSREVSILDNKVIDLINSYDGENPTHEPYFGILSTKQN